MNIYEHFQLSEILYYKIGPKAKFVLKIQNYEDVKEALAFVKKHNIKKVLPVGLGANLLMSEDFFDGAVLWFAKPEESLITVGEDGLIEAFAAHLLDDVIHFSFRKGYIGVEWAGGLPSTVGGAVRGNVGAFGNEIKQIVEKAEVIDTSDKTLNTRILTNKELEFSYRGSIVKQQPHLLVTRVFFRLTPASERVVGDAQNTYFEKMAYRKDHNPIEYPSCGSTFKNITEKDHIAKVMAVWPDIAENMNTKWHGKIAMGYIIRRMGLAGLTIGGGQISDKHANYLINKDHATFKDIYKLLETVKKMFYAEFGFYPEPEVQIIK